MEEDKQKNLRIFVAHAFTRRHSIEILQKNLAMQASKPTTIPSSQILKGFSHRIGRFYSGQFFGKSQHSV